MNSFPNTIKLLMVVATACVLGACGGGGKARQPIATPGSAGGGEQPPVVTPPTPTPSPEPPAPAPTPPPPTPPSPTPPPECGRAIFRDGFWTGTINVDRNNPDLNDYTWTSIGLNMAGKSTATVLPDPAGSGQLVGRFMVPDDGESYRAEIQRKQFDWGHYRYAISHYIPSTWPAFRYGTIVSQWHGFAMPDADGKTVNLNPPIALAVYGLQPKWELHMYRLVSTNPPDTAVTRYPINVPIAYDRWNDWVFDIIWSRRLADGTVTPGLVVVTLNGIEVLRIAGDNNYHQQWSPYFQMGIYRSSWRASPTREQSGGPPVVVYHRNLVVTDLNACTGVRSSFKPMAAQRPARSEATSGAWDGAGYRQSRGVSVPEDFSGPDR